ncbi:trichodiene oxygenase cytochrome P450 [Fusarium acutatum]|uniref:Trichodiene oxygenase cytochrome P450 n=1 Tax=Fusarium acutatum TaxID=78861 RepID=A0A8H4NKL7_9HYPO|nr:trichodiene oxygenase cytochrome P450 [Fusarium acutatum]
MAACGQSYLIFTGAMVWHCFIRQTFSDKPPGPIVRIGPNEVHIEDSEYFDTIFGFRPLNKEAMTAKEFGINHALFGVEDYKTYVKKRAAFGNAFSRTKLSKIQDQINDEIQKGCIIGLRITLAQKLVQKVVAQHNHSNHNTESISRHTVFDDFLDSSLPQEEKEKDPLTQQAVAIWSGGWDTVGFVLTMAAYQLLQNPEVEQRLYQELKEVWKDPTESPEITTLEGLPYLTAVVKETFRLSPGALCRLSRVNPSGIEQYGDWEIPPGTIISMSIPDVLSDKAIWGSDASVFKPERWLSGGTGLDRYLVTFSKGTRVCPGIELAWIETRLVIASLFRRYEMSIITEAGISDDDIMPYYEGFTPAVKNWISRLPVRVKPRY